MKVLLMLPYCSNRIYEKAFPDVSKRTNQQFHKYFSLFTDGLCANGVDVTVGCQFDVNRDISPYKLLHFIDDIENGVRFHYLTTLNVPIIGRLIKFIQGILFTGSFCLKNKHAVVICDPNKVASALGILIGAKLAGGRVVHVLSDLPSINTGSVGKRRTVRQRIADIVMCKADGYFFFTAAMNELVNHNKKPNVIIECLVDAGMAKKENTLAEKYPHRVMMYTGGIVEHYGLETLIEAFLMAGVPDTELWIYGGGSFADKISIICRDSNSIKYLGVLPNEEIIREQQKATVLVNPRSTQFEYTKYSFPSKNMEYMSSGTPTLTTRLPGMPEEYNEHVLLFDGETAPEMAKKIRQVYGMSDEELHNIGMKTKAWVLKEKNHVHQMSLFVDMLRRNYYPENNKQVNR